MAEATVSPAGAIKTPAGESAKRLVRWGLILDIIFSLISLGVTIGTLSAVASSGYALLGYTIYITLLGVVVGFVVLFLVYVFSYRRIREGNYEGARVPTLIWAILSIISIWNIIPGLLYLFAYMRLGKAVQEQRARGGGPVPGVAYAPAAAPAAAAPVAAQVTATPNAAPPPPLCPKCGQPGQFIQQYGRWYCARDQMYY